MKKLIKTGLLLFIISVIYGCSSYQYYAIQSNNTTFSKYRTFAWLPQMDTSKTEKITDIADERIKEVATAELESCGLALKATKPDLLVRYSVVINNMIKTYNNPEYVYPAGGFYSEELRRRNGRNYYYVYAAPFPVYVGGEIVQVPYREGTLVIDLIDRRARRVIWRGYGVGEINDPQTAMRDIPEVVQGILGKLPIKPVTKP